MTVSAHDSDGPLPTYYDSVCSAARRALWSLCHTNRQDLQATEYRHLPRRACGTEETVMTLGGEEGSSVSILARATAALNTDLEGVTTELVRTQDRLMEAHDRIRQLEAQLAGGAPPPAQEEEPPFPALSPLRKKLRFGNITSLED